VPVVPCDLLAMLRGSLTKAIREGEVAVGNEKKGVSGVDRGNLAPDLNLALAKLCVRDFKFRAQRSPTRTKLERRVCENVRARPHERPQVALSHVQGIRAKSHHSGNETSPC